MQISSVCILGGTGFIGSALADQLSKGQGEAVVRNCAGVLPYTIFRPSVAFGRGDRFVNRFASLVQWFPVIPLAAAQARFQPIWVEDVARCFAASVGNARMLGQTYELCGPQAYSLQEIVELVARLLGRKPRIVALPPSLARLQAALFEHPP